MCLISAPIWKCTRSRWRIQKVGQTPTSLSLYHNAKNDFLSPYILAFWKEVADEFFWKKPATGPMLQYNFDVTKGNIFVKCMEGAKTNMCYNVLDRHVKEGNLGEKVAYYW